MKLTRLYKLTEAGKPNKPTSKKKGSRWAFGKKAGNVTFPAHQEPDKEPDDDEDDFAGFDDEEDLGPDIDYEDPSPPPSNKPEPVRPAKPFKEPEKDIPVFGKSMPPSAALQGGKSGGSLNIDRKTLNALEQALENVRTGDEDLQSWIDDALSEIGRALRTGGELKLPKFIAADDDDSEDGSENEDY